MVSAGYLQVKTRLIALTLKFSKRTGRMHFDDLKKPDAAFNIDSDGKHFTGLRYGKTNNY